MDEIKKKRKKNLDVRQIDFLRFYLDPKSESHSNALRSAVRAGYTWEYANSITSLMPDWLSDSMGKQNELLGKAERNLALVLDMDHEIDAMGPFGPIIDKKTKKPFRKVSGTILKIKTDASQFIAETVGKKNGYSKRLEHTGADGEKLTIQISKEIADKNDINDSSSRTG